MNEALPRDKLVVPDRAQVSPSGGFKARLTSAAEQGAVPQWIVVIDDAAGTEVFRDTERYSGRHGVAAVWLSTADQLWVLSSDVGMASVVRDASGTWRKTFVTPETVARVPPEIARWRR